jgi:hypothetical protein
VFRLQSVTPRDIVTDDALPVLAERLSTPLQIEHYLTRVLEQAYRVGEKPVTPALVEKALAPDMHDLEPTLTRYGSNIPAVAELLNIRQAEERGFLHGQLPPGRTAELHQQVLAVGLPLGERLGGAEPQASLGRDGQAAISSPRATIRRWPSAVPPSDPIRTASWPTGLFASRLHTSVGPFARRAGPPVGVFAQSAGRPRPLFASPRCTVRKPLQIPSLLTLVMLWDVSFLCGFRREIIAAMTKPLLLPLRQHGELIIATPERFEASMRNPAYDDWIASIEAVCVDEAHLLGSSHRGPTLEYLLTSLLCLPIPPRLLRLSATLGNADRVQAWLDPCNVIQMTERYPPLQKEVFALAPDDNANTVVRQCAQEWLTDPTAALLIFVCQTRAAESLAGFLRETVGERGVLACWPTMAR